MKEYATLQFMPELFGFSAGHFTIFSPTERERLHGHTYRIGATLKAEMSGSGLSFDYTLFKTKLKSICKSLNSYFLLPGTSSYLKIEEEGGYLWAHFAQEKIPFLKKDAKILPINNVTLEELSAWFVGEIVQDESFMHKNRITELTIAVYNGPGQCAQSGWHEMT